MQQDREEKAQVREKSKRKVFPNLLGKNLTYLLLLFQVAEHASLPSMWKMMVDAPNCQHITTFQRVFDDTSQRLSVGSPIIVAPILLKMTLDLVFHLNHRDNLGTGLHLFYLIQHKVLNACSDQHQVVAGGGGTPTLVDACYLPAPDGVSLPEKVVMAWSAHARLQLSLETLIRRDHPSSHAMDAVVFTLIER